MVKGLHACALYIRLWLVIEQALLGHHVCVLQS